MKKMVCITSIIFMIVSLGLMVYAQEERITISESNLSDLKGKWVGTRTFTSGSGRSVNTDLEIFNDTLPLEGKFILYDVRPTAGLGGKRGGSSSETETHNFKDVRINEQGNFHWKKGSSEIELSLYKEKGEMKLKGDYVLGKSIGIMSFTKE